MTMQQWEDFLFSVMFSHYLLYMHILYTSHISHHHHNHHGLSVVLFYVEVFFKSEFSL